MRCTMLLLVLLAFDVLATAVWTWVDKDGVRHYSQTPIAGAARVDIGPSNRSVPHAPAAASTPLAESSQGDASAARARYAEFSIARPAEGETLSNTGGVVPVEVRLDPQLRPGHEVVLYLDDRRVDGGSRTATRFEVKDVPRGTHLLVAVIRDEQRNPLHEAAVTFHVRQTSSLKPGPPKPVQPLPKPN